MARDFIKISTDATTVVEAVKATEYKSWLTELRRVFDRGQYFKQAMDHMTDGTNFADIEQRFGLPAGTGQTVYNLTNNAIGAGAKNLTEQVG